MKKNLLLMVLPLLLALFAVPACADTLQEEAKALKAAETFDGQLAVLNRIAEEHADELDAEGWNVQLNVSAAAGLTGTLIPRDFDNYGYEKASALPEEARGRRFIALALERGSAPKLAGAWLARFPEAMRARTLDEAEYALVVESFWTPSGYEYIPPASSSHRDYHAFVLSLKTGEAVRFWTHRNKAKTSGRMGQLNGDNLSEQEIWTAVRTEILGRVRYGLKDGSALLFSLSGKNCFLTGYEGEPVTVGIPAEVEGHPVTEIGKACFSGCRTLESISFPASLEAIGDEAFMYCERLKAITLPDGLRTIGESAFSNCDSLTAVTLPGSLVSIGDLAFKACDRLSRVVVRDGVPALGKNMLDQAKNLAFLYLPGDAAGIEKAGISAGAAVCAREGSAALEAARAAGFETVPCAGPEEVPAVRFVTEGDFEFRIVSGEAALSAYLGKEEAITVPSSAGGVPVVQVLSRAVYYSRTVKSVTLPESVRLIRDLGLQMDTSLFPCDIYVLNPDCAVETDGIVPSFSSLGKYTVTIHAAPGGSVQLYAEKTAKQRKYLTFESWDEGTQP